MTETRGAFDPLKLAHVRRERGLSQRALAAGAGVSQSLIAELERGKHPPTEQSLGKIAKALGLSGGSELESQQQH